MASNEGVEVGGIGGQADEVGDIEGEEIRTIEKSLDNLEIDVVGIDKVWPLPALLPDGPVGLIANAGRLGADDAVLAEGFVPDGRNLDALALGNDQASSWAQP